MGTRARSRGQVWSCPQELVPLRWCGGGSLCAADQGLQRGSRWSCPHISIHPTLHTNNSHLHTFSGKSSINHDHINPQALPPCRPRLEPATHTSAHTAPSQPSKPPTFSRSSLSPRSHSRQRGPKNPILWVTVGTTELPTRGQSWSCPHNNPPPPKGILLTHCPTLFYSHHMRATPAR